MKPTRILIVDDDKAFRLATVALLQDVGYTTTTATNGKEAMELLATMNFDLVLSDLVMEGVNGIQLLQHVKNHHPDLSVIMITGFGSIQTAVDAIRFGAYDYVTKPCNNDELLIKVSRALEDSSKTRELQYLRNLIRSEANFSNIVSRNEKMKQIFKLVNQVAGTDVTVLILGETGTGKELLAKAIHFNSPRRTLPFIPVQCSAIPDTLLEGELFGHEKGAFTGATKLRIGKFEEANGGTIFLDEIADIPMNLQTKLLRILQEKQIVRLGSNTPLPVDVRIIAATNRNLESMSAEGTFREDLYYRLNVFPLTIPPLRERLEDIPLLAEHFLEKHRALSLHSITGFSPSCIHDMMNYPWKGNIRELENLIKRAIIKTEGNTVTRLEIASPQFAGDEPLEEITPLLPFKKYIQRIVGDAEKKYLIRILQQCKGNLNQASRIMDIDRKTIYRKIEEFQIDVKQFK
jgi:DNA-binding NtrC family response regulator